MEEINAIIAAGAVVWRRNSADQIEITLIHRVKYNDWSLPKGKIEGKESLIACAYREVVEETGFAIRFGQCLGTVEYFVEEVPKAVTYWAAKYLAVDGAPNPVEVEEVRWVLASEAGKLLTRALDNVIIEKFLQLDLDAEPLVLLRHAKAIAREDWLGEDTDRPLSSLGERQAKRLLSNLLPYAIEEMHSSSAVRCYETITPMARALRIDFFFSENLSEDAFRQDGERPVKYVQRLLLNDYPTLLCSHNPVIPGITSSFVDKYGLDLTYTKLEPGDAWVAHHIDREVVSLEFLPAPKV